ncbi:hypothetical protein Hanom_Chr11g00987301 [Helianthus anomalus]
MVHITNSAFSPGRIDSTIIMILEFVLQVFNFGFPSTCIIKRVNPILLVIFDKILQHHNI